MVEQTDLQQTVIRLMRRYTRRIRRLYDKVAEFSEGLDDPKWVFLTVVLGMSVLYLPWKLPNFLSLTPYSSVWILAGFLGVSVTLLALLYAVLTFRGQQLAARLPSELVGELFEPRWHRASFWRLLTIFLISLLTLAPISQDTLPAAMTNGIVASLVLLSLAVVSVQRGIGRVFDRRYSQVVAGRTARRITDSYLLNQPSRFTGFSVSEASGVMTDVTDPFALSEQVSVRAMKEGDLTTAHLVLRAITGRVLDFVTKEAHHSRIALEWLGEFLSVVGRKALPLDDRTAELIMVLFRDVVRRTLEQHLPWSDRIELMRSFQGFRHAAIQERKSAVVTRSLHVLGDTFEHAIRNAPPEEKVWLLHAREPSQPTHDTQVDLEWEHIYSDWLYPLLRDIELIVAEDLPDAFATGLFVQSQMARDVLQSTDLGNRQKQFLLGQLLWQAKSVVLEAIRRGRSEAYVSWEFHFDILDELKDKGLVDLATQALNEWAEVIIEASKAGKLPWIMLNQFAAEGRGCAREGRDELGAIAAETLGAIAAPLATHADGEMRERYLEAAAGLESIGKWDERAESKLKEVVQTELAKYSEREARLQAWRESTPARRRIPPGDARSTPSA